MDKKQIIKRLKAISNADSQRSVAARFRDIYEEIENALAAGVPRAVVVKELFDNGLEMTLSTFDTNLKRTRKKFQNPRTQRTQKTQVVNKPSEVIEKPVDPVTPSHDPTALDKIIESKPDLTALAKLAKRTKS